jgi:outer membrane translocation and assembly module TamA
MSVASRAAPLALWQGAGTGQARSGLLRAHPLLDDGVLTGPVFGRGVAHASLEYARPVKRTRAGSLSIAGFVDAARAWHRLNDLGTSPLYIDAGAGLRFGGPGPGGAIRIDIAHGLRGGGTTISASWGGAGRR